MDGQEKRNLLLTVVIVTGILMGWSFFFPTPSPENTLSSVSPAGENISKAKASQDNRGTQQPSQGTNQHHAQKSSESSSAEAILPVIDEQGGFTETSPPKDSQTRAQVIQSSDRFFIRTPKVSGSVRLKGMRLDDLTLLNYTETTDPHSPPIHLLSPGGTEHPYYAEFSWAAPNQNTPLPTANSLWQVEGNRTLTPDTPVTVFWENGQGLRFEQTIAVDQEYLFTITQRVVNAGHTSVTLSPYGLLSRHGKPKTTDFFILHEGPLGYLNNKLIEYKYDDLKDKKSESIRAHGGWLGITDKYWLTALIPDQQMDVKTYFRSSPVHHQDQYQVDFMGPARTLAPGEHYDMTSHLFAGAKVLKLLDGYEVTLGVKNFDLAVDFGWFYLITKPIFVFLTWLYQEIGNLGLAILILTLLLKLAFLPLANKSYRSMAHMKDVQPKIEKLRERFSEDKMRLNQEIMDLYKKEKVNPMAGCLPMLIQIPVFFALYKVLFVTLEMRHAPFFGWIQDLSAPDPTSIANLFGLLPWTPPGFLMVGVWPLIMGVTMYLQQKLNPPPADPTQAKVFALMPILFTFMLAQFPAGLVIYWAWNNVLTIGQQWLIMRLEHRKRMYAS